jgi:hypothetical protein
MLKYLYDRSGNMVSQTAVNILLPKITGQPVKRIVEPGQFATFSVLVEDTSGVTFQWKFNGTDIPGATGDSLLLTDVGDANEGQYSVVVTNSAGSVTSPPAALMLDKDRDGLPDSWEMANLGNLDQRGAGDPDGDGISNVDEFFNDTYPNSSASLRPRLIAYSDTGGSVTVSPMKLNYELGEIVTLTATATAPSAFIGWAGDLDIGNLVNTTNPVSFVMTGNKTVRARFASAVPLPPGLVAFWRGEADTTDLIGGYNGAFFSGTSAVAPSISRYGKVGGAFAFDGTVHIRVPDSGALRLAQFTIEAWVFPTLLSSSYQGIVAFGSSNSENDTWALTLSNGKPQFFSHGITMLEGPSTIPLNQWTHLAISFDGNFKRLYVNGAQVASQERLGALLYDANPIPVTIGSDWAFNVSNSRFHGLVDELAIYNRALTINEVLDIYNADFTGKDFTRPYFTSPSPLPDVSPGASYSEQLMTVLGTAPISFSLSAGALPPGIALSPTGLVSGASNASGIFDFTVLAKDAAGNSTEQLYVLRVLQPIELPADMVAWWPGEPAAGGTVRDTFGGHDGGFFSGNSAASPSYTPGGKVGSAFTFDGTVYVQIPDSADLRPNELTAEAWVFPTLLSGDMQTVIARGSTTNQSVAWWMGVVNGMPRFISKHISGISTLDAPSAIPLNKWTHLAVSFGSGTKRLYVNGLQVNSQSVLGQLSYEPPVIPVTIGAKIGSNVSSARFTGRVDEVTLYRRALSSDEIFSIADAGGAGKRTTGPYINSPSQLLAAIVGQGFSHTFTSVLGTAPVEYALSTSSILPPALALNSTGVLTGVPVSAGRFAFVVRATDATGLFAEQRCTLQIFESVPVPAGAVGWWKAEGDAQDSIGANHGALRNGAGFSPSNIGQAFALDGSTSFIEIPDTPALRPISLTLEAWVAFDTISGTRVIFAKPVGTGISDSYALWIQGGGTLHGGVGDATAPGSNLGSGVALIPGQWHHVAYTFDDAAKQQALYVDGIQVAAGTASKSIGYDAQPLLIGRDNENGVPNFFLQGRIDEASIYNRSLSPMEIASIYSAGPAGKRLVP